jgi:hypothetical protein
VNAGWVAGSVRARLLLGRRAGPDVARRVARAGSLPDAIETLRLSPAGYTASLTRDASLEEVQRAVASSVALSVRVLAAWLPRGAAGDLRALASWFELVNLEDRIAYLAGGDLRPTFELGVLSSVWQAAAEASSLEELRRLLGRSAWGDAGGDDPRELQLWLRLAWAKRVARQVPGIRAWAEGALAILLAAEMFVAGRFFEPLGVRGLGLGLGQSWVSAATLADLRERLPRRAAWTLDGIEQPAALWQAELAWWRRVRLDAEGMIRGRLDRGEIVVGAVALLALDAMRVNAGLAAAARSNAPGAQEVVDALC